MGVLALTERGRALLEARRYRDPADGPAQAVYGGWHKPAEVVHDASLYRMTAGEKKPDESPVFSDETGEPVGSFRTAWVSSVLRAHDVKVERLSPL